MSDFWDFKNKDHIQAQQEATALRSRGLTPEQWLRWIAWKIEQLKQPQTDDNFCKWAGWIVGADRPLQIRMRYRWDYPIPEIPKDEQKRGARKRIRSINKDIKNLQSDQWIPQDRVDNSMGIYEWELLAIDLFFAREQILDDMPPDQMSAWELKTLESLRNGSSWRDKQVDARIRGIQIRTAMPRYEGSTPPVVVNIRKSEYDLYIGRKNKSWGLRQSVFANPFKVGKDGDLRTVLDKYREYIQQNEKAMRLLPKLKGKRLGCWCKPNECHGDVLVELYDLWLKKSGGDRNYVLSEEDLKEGVL